ncbi:DUF5958 family protein [Streptomyces sp. NPDC057486]|uniref:DUF5958 family protein n=1 Tax=Streptomyces sp. NPDC057486 TaxID=3346145 RepID=UPI00369CADF3
MTGSEAVHEGVRTAPQGGTGREVVARRGLVARGRRGRPGGAARHPDHRCGTASVPRGAVMNERDVLLNELAQGLRPMSDGIGWFDGLSQEEQSEVLLFLRNHCVQARAVTEDAPESILWGSESHRCRSSRVPVLVDDAAEDAGAQEPVAFDVVCRSRLLVGAGR